MNNSIIRYILGSVLKLEAALLLLPLLVSAIYREEEGTMYLPVISFCLIVGTLMTLQKPKDDVFGLKEGCIATALSWIMMSVVGAIPFVLTKEIPGIVDAVFETVSGFTTTGASILTDVEALSHTSLLWRSMTHWIGGMGVLVFLLAVVQMNGGSNMNLMRAESPGPSVGKLVPKVKQTARILYVIYFFLTLLEFLLLVMAKMPVFDSICTAFGTAGTGGFGIRNDSFTSYPAHMQWIVTVFMILFGVNFNAYYLLLFGKIKKAFKMEEVRSYFLIILLAVGILTEELVRLNVGLAEAVRQAAFQVASIITTTGFSSADFDQWTTISKTILVLLMFVGACAGSTGGGVKVSRFLIMLKTVKKELNSYLHPKSIKIIKMDDKPIEHEVLRSTNVYMITFFCIFVFSILAISVEEHDLVTNFTAVAATINNIGPGLSMVGPTQNFAFFGSFSKIILIFDMLAGRLELFPLLILIYPSTWKELLSIHRFSCYVK